MELLYVSLAGFKRFERHCTVRLDGRLIAVVGANEAGKSSLLEVMALLNDEEEVPKSSLTRNGNTTFEVRAAFVLDDEDRQAIDNIPSGRDVRRCTFVKRAAGPIIAELDPSPPHDLAPRGAMHDRLNSLKGSKELSKADRNNRTPYKDQQLTAAIRATGQEDVMLNADDRKALRTLAGSLGRLTDATAKTTAQEIAVLLAHEDDNPTVKAQQVMLARRPRFVEFGQEHRELTASYDLARRAFPAALQNVARLADLNLDQLADAAAAEDAGVHADLVRRANTRLQTQFAAGWGRNDIAPYLDLQGTVLHLLVTDSRGTFPITERSEGLRQFVALQAFLHRQQHDTRPVLLIDEAETHLSYDAQASLIEMLSQQQVTQKIIYTTHSAGCLPADLGTGVRPVIPDITTERSTVSNQFWTKRPGFTPLMLAMGANALAFTPGRYVIIGEGASECLLLPTLLREATKYEVLPYQVAPGLSEATESQIAELDAEAGQVVYLLDDDPAGRKRKEKLITLGVDQERILTYANVGGTDLTLEDFVEQRIYTESVIEELTVWQQTGPDVQPPEGGFPSPGRWQATQAFCTEFGLDAPTKATLCQRIVDKRWSNRILLAPARQKLLAALHERLIEILKIPKTMDR